MHTPHITGDCCLRHWGKLSLMSALWTTAAAGQSMEAQLSSSHHLPLSIRGNARSATVWVESLVRRCLETISEDRLSELEQCVMNSRQFSRVHVQRPAAGGLDIEVEDRWTLIAVPVFIQNSEGERTVGAFGVESNFLGRGKLLMVGALWSTQGMFANFGLYDRSINFTPWRGGFFATRALSQSRLRIRENVTEDAFTETLTGTGVNLGYELSTGWAPQMGLDWSRRTYKSLDRFSAPQDLNQLKINFSLPWRKTNYRLYFDEGAQAGLQFSTQLWRSNGARSAQMDGRWYQGVSSWSDHAILLQAQGSVITGSDRRDSRRMGGGAGMRGFLAGSLWLTQMASVALDYQIPLWRGEPGTWTIAPFLDAGTLQTAKGKSVSFTAQGLGTYFFLKRISLPGMGLYATYNHTTRKPLVQFAVGAGGGPP